MFGGEQFYYVVLHGIRVLELVDENVAELVRKEVARLLVAAEQAERANQQVVEVERVIGGQVLVVLIVDAHDVVHARNVLEARAVGVGVKTEHFGVAYVILGILQQFFVVEVKLLEGLFDDVGALGFGVDGKVALYARLGGKLPQNAHAHRVDCAYPHARRIAEHTLKALAHFARRLVGEGYGQYALGRTQAFFEYVRYARG